MKDMPKTSLVKVEIDDCVARVTLARSEKYNALNVQMITELIECFLGRLRIQSESLGN